MSKLFASKTGRALIAGASVLALVASTGPRASGGGTDAAGLTGAPAVAPVDAQVSRGARFAVIDADGAFVRGKGVVSSANLGAGAYEVIFNKNIRGCGYVATIGLPGDS